MAETPKDRHCPRCGNKGKVNQTETELIYTCPNQHGVIWKEKLPEPEAQPEPSAADLDAVADDQKQAEATQKREPKALN